MDPMDDEYLWDRTGPPDEEVARLEALLAPIRRTGGGGVEHRSRCR